MSLGQRLLPTPPACPYMGDDVVTQPGIWQPWPEPSLLLFLERLHLVCSCPGPSITLSSLFPSLMLCFFIFSGLQRTLSLSLET